MPIDNTIDKRLFCGLVVVRSTTGTAGSTVNMGWIMPQEPRAERPQITHGPRRIRGPIEPLSDADQAWLDAIVIRMLAAALAMSALGWAVYAITFIPDWVRL